MWRRTEARRFPEYWIFMILGMSKAMLSTDFSSRETVSIGRASRAETK